MTDTTATATMAMSHGVASAAVSSSSSSISAGASSSTITSAFSFAEVWDSSAWVQSALSLWHTGAVSTSSSSALSLSTALTTSSVLYPFSVLFLSGALFRFICSLPWTLYGELALRRLHRARPALVEAYREYLFIATHPKSISWEKKVAAERLSYTRRGILRHFKTSNLRVYLPFLLATGLNLGFLLGPVVAGGMLGGFLVQHSFSPGVAPITTTTAASMLASDRVVTPAMGTLVTQVSALQHDDYCPSPFLFVIHLARPLFSPASSTAAGGYILVDPTWALASLLTWMNLYYHFSLRGKKGMGAKSFAVQQQGWRWSRRWCTSIGLAGGGLIVLPLWSLFTSCIPFASTVVAAASGGEAIPTTTSGRFFSTLADPLWWSLLILPSYIAPVWLGMAATTLMKNGFMMAYHAYATTTTTTDGKKTSLGVDTASLSTKQDGFTSASSSTKKEKEERDVDKEEEEQQRQLALLDTSNSHPYKLSFSGEEAEERREMWKIQKKMLEYECDVRLFRYVRRLWTPAEELEEEAQKLQKKVAIARERRAQRNRQTSAPSSQGSQQVGGQVVSEEDEREMKMVIQAQQMRNTIYEKRYARTSSPSPASPHEAEVKGSNTVSSG